MPGTSSWEPIFFSNFFSPRTPICFRPTSCKTAPSFPEQPPSLSLCALSKCCFCCEHPTFSPYRNHHPSQPNSCFSPQPLVLSWVPLLSSLAQHSNLPVILDLTPLVTTVELMPCSTWVHIYVYVHAGGTHVHTVRTLSFICFIPSTEHRAGTE